MGKKQDKKTKGGTKTGVAGRFADTQKKVAEIFQVSVRTVQFWIQDGMPQLADGRYDLDQIAAWKEMRDRARRDPEDDRESAANARFREFKAKLAEIEYRKKIGELIDREEVKAGWVQRVMVVKRALLSLSRTLAPQVANKDAKLCQAIIDKRIREVIGSFANS